MHKELKLSLKRDRYLFPSFSQIEDKYPPNKSPGMGYVPGKNAFLGESSKTVFLPSQKRKSISPLLPSFPYKVRPEETVDLKSLRFVQGRREEREAESKFFYYSSSSSFSCDPS